MVCFKPGDLFAVFSLDIVATDEPSVDEGRKLVRDLGVVSNLLDVFPSVSSVTVTPAEGLVLNVEVGFVTGLPVVLVPVVVFFSR